MNDYFANIGSRLNIVDCSSSTLEDLDELYQEMQGISFALPEVDLHDVLFLSKEIDVHKSSCIPGMHSDVCKYLLENFPNRFVDWFC